MTSFLKFIIGSSILSLTLGMTGCGNDEKNTQPTNEISSNRPVIQVVTDGESPPMSFVDERGNPQGIDIDIIRAIGESQGFDVEIHRDIFNNIFKNIDNGKYQLTISSLSLTPERAEKYGVSDSYLYNPAIVMHNRSGNFKKLDDIKGLRMATTKGTMFTPIAEELKPTKHNINNTNFQNYQNLIQDHVDAIMGDKYVLEYMASRHPQKALGTFEYKIGDGSSANMVIYTKKGNQELLDKLNKGISQLKQSGKIDSIVQSYLTAKPQVS